MIKNLNYWAQPKRISGSIYNFPSKDYVIPEPYGCVLNISPWNYPFNLALVPTIGAVAAGNTVVIKPSEHSPEINKILVNHKNSIFIHYIYSQILILLFYRVD